VRRGGGSTPEPGGANGQWVPTKVSGQKFPWRLPHHQLLLDLRLSLLARPITSMTRSATARPTFASSAGVHCFALHQKVLRDLLSIHLSFAPLVAHYFLSSRRSSSLFVTTCLARPCPGWRKGWVSASHAVRSSRPSVWDQCGRFCFALALREMGLLINNNLSSYHPRARVGFELFGREMNFSLSLRG